MLTLNRRDTANNPRDFENNESDSESVFLAIKITKDRKLTIIGSSLFKKWFLNNNDKLWKTFNFKIFKKDRFIDINNLPNWVNIMK